jgi:NTP pyrophosphatase (non-canonical NTP hydrolase)
MEKEQKAVDDWFKHAGAEYWKPLEMMARLSEETGELARELNHRFGPKKKKSQEDVREVGDEIADIIVTLCCMANSLNIDLDESFKHVVDKLYKRDTAIRGKN